MIRPEIRHLPRVSCRVRIHTYAPAGSLLCGRQLRTRRYEVNIKTGFTRGVLYVKIELEE